MARQINWNWREQRRQQSIAIGTDERNRAFCYISYALDITVFATPKIGSQTIGQCLADHPQFIRTTPIELSARPTRRIIAFHRPVHERVVSAYSSVFTDFRKQGSFAQCVDWIAENPLRDAHCYPPQRWVSCAGRSLPTEWHALHELTAVLEAIPADPPLQVRWRNRDCDNRKPYADYYTPELWDKVTAIYAEYQ